MNLIAKLEQEEIARALGEKTIPEFAPGDTVIVSVNVVEGTRKRVQAYEGVVIAKRNRGLNSSFIVRKISSGEGVERSLQVREGDVGPDVLSIAVHSSHHVLARQPRRRSAVDPAQLARHPHP